MEKITLEKARELLKKAVATQGRDFVYNPDSHHHCFYKPIKKTPKVSDDDPRLKTGCIIGVALDLHGEKRHRDQRGSVIVLSALYPEMMEWIAVKYFSVAQTKQDFGSTWGEAYDAAEKVVQKL